MPRGKHEKGDFYHIRARHPKSVRGMKTVTFGTLKRVRGIDRKTDKWVNQNYLIPKRNAKVIGSRLIVTNINLRRQLKDEGVKLSKIRRMETGGKMDYTLRG